MFKILVPVNVSEASSCAVDDAIRAAASYRDATILLVNVQPQFNRHIARFLTRAQMDQARRERAAAALVPAQRKLEAAGLHATAHILRGSVLPALARFAADRQVDQIVVGTVPLSGMARWFKRPLADRLIRATDIPVEVVSTGHAGAFERYGVPAGVGLGLTMAWLAAE